MNLNSIFSSIAYKKLAQVDIPGGSHQHEINGSNALRTFFDSEQTLTGEITWYYFADDLDPIHATGEYKFYDSREKSSDRTGRSEWRMYYKGEFLKNATSGDLLILGRTKDQKIFGLVFQDESGWLRAAQILFEFESPQDSLQVVEETKLSKLELEYYKQQILNEMGIEVQIPVESRVQTLAIKTLEMARKEGKSFPTTQTMALLSWENSDVDINNEDSTLITWLAKEESIFRAIEKIVVQEKLEKNFESVDDFINYSLSVQNRRKSRMGFALQNHLQEIFIRREIKFQTQKTTEGKNKPDFLFPGQEQYLDNNFDSSNLYMLGAKSTCKDRWRQILTEAIRIKTKHLCTLEQAISTEQTNEMKSQSVILVIPELFRKTYKPEQQHDILTVHEFIEIVKEKQSQKYSF